MGNDEKIDRMLGKIKTSSDDSLMKKIYGDKERFSSDKMEKFLGKSKDKKSEDKELSEDKIKCPKCGHKFSYDR